MGRGKGFPGRLLAQDVLPAIGIQQERRVGLSTLELPNVQPLTHLGQFCLKPGQQPLLVKPVCR
jgi:hypothetical protein